MQLIKHIHNADYKAISKIITKDPAVMFLRVADPFNQQEKISPLQYAIKIQDNYLVDNFLHFIGDNKNQVAQFIRQGKQQHKYLDFSQLFLAYEEFFNVLDERGDLKSAYLKLGMSQREHLPVHLIKLMCEITNWQISQPITRPLLSAPSLLNIHTNKDTKILPKKDNKGLGYEFALLSIFGYTGVLSTGDAFRGSAVKGLLEVHQQNLTQFQVNALAQWQKIIEKAQQAEQEMKEQKDPAQEKDIDEVDESANPSLA